jgi:hypothetical protein
VVSSRVMHAGRARPTFTRTLAALAVLTGTLACGSDDDAPSNPSGSGGLGGGGASSTGGDAGRGAAGMGRGGAPGTGGSAAGAGATSGGRASTAGRPGSGDAGSGGASGASDGGTSGSAGAGGSDETPVVCVDQCHYVRAGATGSGDGSSWSNAYPELPPELERGHAYFVATGAYPEYTFDDAPDGTARILVRGATPGDHGDDDGWDDAFASGAAVFGELRFEAPGYDFDGSGAVRVEGSFEGTAVSIDADDVSFANTDVDGRFALDGDTHVEGACTGMNVSGNDVIVRGNRVHDIADDGVVVYDSDRFSFEGNEIDALFGCGTDGGCGPCDNGHSDGLEIYAVRDSRFVGNFAHDIQSTSAFFFGNWADELGNGPSDYCENILLANNVLYNFDTGFVAYLEDVRGVELFHNTIWGQHAGRYGGLAIGVNVEGLNLVNNVILSINFEHLGSVFDASRHQGDYNLFGISLGQWTDAEHDLVALDPGFAAIPDGDGAKVDAPTPADFTPTDTSPLRGAGTSDAPSALPTTDFFGTERGTPPTIGAIE